MNEAAAAVTEKKKIFSGPRTIRTRLIGIIVPMLVMILLVNLYIFSRINSMVKRIDSVFASNVSMSELAENLSRLDSNVYEYLSTKSSSALENYYRYAQSYKDLAEQLNGRKVDNALVMLEKNIRGMSLSYLEKAEEAIQAKRGRNVERYKSAYESGRQIYDYINNNPRMKVLPVDYVNDPAVIAQLDNFMSINGAVEVDILGQVSAESVGTKHISGTGGQVDYVQGATHSKGGKSFIAFSSTTAGGKVSRIKNILTPGSVVTTSKNDVDYIVTEYGMAKLRGQTIGSRTRQLISIAHPDFRDELTFEAKKRGIIV